MTAEGSYGASLSALESFEEEAADPAGAQERRLRAIIESAAGSGFGRRFRLADVRTLDDLQERVPLGDYATHRAWIDQAAAGEADVLTTSRLHAFEPTSGSSGDAKLIPYTDGLLDEFGAAVGAWLGDLEHASPGILEGPAYWAISPPVRAATRTGAGIQIGLGDDLAYVPPRLRRAVARTLVRPRLDGASDWAAATATALAEEKRLGIVSVWSPTFLLRILRTLERHPLVRHNLSSARRADLDACLRDDGTLRADAFWPSLRLVSCWTSGHSAGFMEDVRRRTGEVLIQGKGLMATEGVVSVPIGLDQDPVLALTSHVLEFIEVAHPGRAPVPPHELRVGGSYEPVITTSGGLYRYRLRDVVRCTGRYKSTPRVRFEGRTDTTSDLVGEKVTDDLAGDVMDEIRRVGVPIGFSLLAPSISPGPHYRLYVDGVGTADAARAERAAEERLRRAYHYRLAQDLGQLGPLRVIRVKDGWRDYETRLGERGRRIGTVKPPLFETSPEWDDVFEEAPA